MSKGYKPSRNEGNALPSSIIGLAAALLVFAILPTMHILGDVMRPGPETEAIRDSVTPPPPIQNDPDPPKKPDPPKDPPKLKEPLPIPNLSQIEMLINSGLRNGNVRVGWGSEGLLETSIDNLYDRDELDKEPRPLVQVQPTYPYEMKRARISGWVELEWIIDSRGKVTDVHVTRSSRREFEKEAIKAILISKWTPGEKGGKPVATRVRQRVEFN